MKKILSFFALPILLAGCADYQENDLPITTNNKGPIFHASVETQQDESRTYLEEGKYMRWHADDEIAIFNGSTQLRQYQFMGESGDPEGDFEQIASIGTIGNSLDCNYALYPYAEDVTILSGGVITFTLSETQLHPSAVEESTPGFTATTEPYEEEVVVWSRSQINKSGNTFAPGSNPMMATTKSKEDLELKFKNLCGYLKLKLYGDDVTVQSITLSGNNGEPLAGAATATMNHGELPTLAMGQDAGTLLTLDCGDGVTLSTDAANPTEFLFVVPSQTFTKGLTITVTDTEGKTFVKSTSKQVVVDRNVIQPMATLKVSNMFFKPKNNEIWYTSTNKIETRYWNTDTFGAEIDSNVWDSGTGKGVITFKKEVTSIGDRAFFNCSSLTSVTIPDSVTSIGMYAFSNCDGLTSVTIGNVITSIGEQSFNGCFSLTAFYGKFASEDNRCLIVDGVLNSFAPSGLTEYTIPDGVTSIGSSAFYSCTDLTSVTIPNNVTSIGERAFGFCTGLTSVTIPDSVSSIGDEAFFYCRSLTSVTIPDGVASIGDYAFSNCTGLTAFYGKYASADNRCLIVDGVLNSFAPSRLTEYTIPDSVTSIRGGAFQGCFGLTSVTIGNSVTSIGDYAFTECSGLTSVTIPDSVTSIGRYAFNFCGSLTSVTIGNGVTSIGICAFDGCTGLTSVTIPDSVTSIGGSAFYGCDGLTSVYCKPTTPPSGGSYMFYYNASDRKIYVPNESVDAYKTAGEWNEYADAIVGYNFEE